MAPRITGESLPRLSLAGAAPRDGVFDAGRLIGDAERRQRPPGDAELGRGLTDGFDRLERRAAEVDRGLAAGGGGCPGRFEELLAGGDQLDRAGPDPLRGAGEGGAAKGDAV